MDLQGYQLEIPIKDLINHLLQKKQVCYFLMEKFTIQMI